MESLSSLQFHFILDSDGIHAHTAKPTQNKMWKKKRFVVPNDWNVIIVIQQKTKQNRRKYVASWKQEKKSIPCTKRLTDDSWQWMTHTGHKTHKWTLQLWKCDSNVVSIVGTNLSWAQSKPNYDRMEVECGVASKFRSFTQAFGSITLIDAAFD